MLIARVDGQRAGLVAVSRQAEQGTFINFLLVIDAVGGVAKRLFDCVIDHARRQGCESVRLETFSILTAAREMYRRYGFELVEVVRKVKRYGRIFVQEFWELKLRKGKVKRIVIRRLRSKPKLNSFYATSY